MHILPDLLHTFSQRHPNITFELLQGSYEDIERWLSEGRIDLGFLRLPTNSHFECTLLLEERILAIFPEDQAPEEDTFPVEALKQAPYILRPDSLDNETREIFRKTLCNPRITYSAKDDYAVMAMVERGLGTSIPAGTLLKRTPYRLAKRELSPPATRQIVWLAKTRRPFHLRPGSFFITSSRLRLSEPMPSIFLIPGFKIPRFTFSFQAVILQMRMRRGLRRTTGRRRVMAKFVTAQEAVQYIHSGDRVALAHSVGEPQALVNAMLDNYQAYQAVEICHMLALGPCKYTRPEMAGHFWHNSLFAGRAAGMLSTREELTTHPISSGNLPAFFTKGFFPLT